VQRFAVAGLTGAAIIEALMNYALGQQVPKDDERIKASYETLPSPNGNGYIRGYFVRPFSAPLFALNRLARSLGCCDARVGALAMSGIGDGEESWPEDDLFDLPASKRSRFFSGSKSRTLNERPSNAIRRIPQSLG
jgi:hypothetical protein